MNLIYSLFKRLIFTSLGHEWLFIVSVNIRKLIYGNYIQCVTYHDTPSKDMCAFRRHMSWYVKHFVDCSVEDLEFFLKSGEWKYAKPGLIISFDDGLMSNYEIAVPVLEEFGFTGWFMIAARSPGLERSDQANFACLRSIDYDGYKLPSDIFMRWSHLKNIKGRGHVIGCHSMNHIRLHDFLNDEEVFEETIQSKKMLESQLQDDIRTFSWVGGERWAYGRSIYLKLKEARYDFIFCTNCKPITKFQDTSFLERYHVGADYQLSEVRVVLGGLYDLLYFLKRRYVFRHLR